MRKASIKRVSKETQIEFPSRSRGMAAIRSPPAFASSITCSNCSRITAAFDLKLKANGDLDVDQHHTVEDVGIVLGQAFEKALGTKRGILRAGYFVMPMDETMGLAAVDFSGRTARVVDTKVRTTLVGDLQSEFVDDFFEGFCPWRASQCSCARALWPVQPPQNRSSIQSLRPSAACCLLARSADAQPSAQHKGSPLMIAIVDYGAGNLVSVKKAFDWLHQDCVYHCRSEAGREGG